MPIDFNKSASSDTVEDVTPDGKRICTTNVYWEGELYTNGEQQAWLFSLRDYPDVTVCAASPDEFRDWLEHFTRAVTPPSTRLAGVEMEEAMEDIQPIPLRPLAPRKTND